MVYGNGNGMCYHYHIPLDTISTDHQIPLYFITEELSEDSDEDLNNTIDDADNEDQEIFGSISDQILSLLDFVFESYLPCAAHNGQLVLKDGLQLDEAPCQNLGRDLTGNRVRET